MKSLFTKNQKLYRSNFLNVVKAFLVNVDLVNHAILMSFLPRMSGIIRNLEKTVISLENVRNVAIIFDLSEKCHRNVKNMFFSLVRLSNVELSISKFSC